MPYKDPEKKKEYQRVWLQNRRLEFFKDKSCVKCGSTKELELDHIDPKLKIDHRIFSWSKERREEELAKCQVLCKICHLFKTRTMAPHGSITRYRHHGCRCTECRQTHNRYMNEYKQRRNND